MKRVFLLILTLLPTLAYGQAELDVYQEIVLVDYQNWNYQNFHGRTYLIRLSEKPLRLYDLKIMTGMELLEQLKNQNPERWQMINSISPDSIEKKFQEIKKLKDEYKPIPEIVREIETSTIENLKRAIVRNSKRGQILDELSLTKDSIDKNLNKYLLKYLTENNIKYNEGKLNYCRDKLSDYEVFKRTAMSITHGGATSDYPTVSIEFRSQKDTLTFYTMGQHSYMLPWFDKMDNEYSYNPNLSKEVGQLLPDSKFSNRNRLLGKKSLYGDYLTELYFITIRTHCINDNRKLITQ